MEDLKFLVCNISLEGLQTVLFWQKICKLYYLFRYVGNLAFPSDEEKYVNFHFQQNGAQLIGIWRFVNF